MKKYLFYNELTLFFIFSKSWKKIIINFIINLFSTKQKDYIYNFILIVINKYTKITQYITVRKTINTIELTEIFVNHIYKNFDYSKNIIINRKFIFISKY